MKRINNLYAQICNIENLELADTIARRGKLQQYGVRLHDANREANILALHHSLVNQTFTTGSYTHRTIHEPKERQISILQYYPDRIVHHAVMNVLEPIFVKCFTRDSYSCIKGKGIHAAHYQLIDMLRDVEGTQYYLKLDIRKFYPSINHDVLKALLRRKFKDAALLQLLDNIIDSAPGLPIGNYLSQYFANFYLNGLDHFIKEQLRVKNYVRYADDMVILADSKPALHKLLWEITAYLQLNLKLEVKGNYRVAPVRDGIDVLGYVYRHTHVMLRKSTKQNFARMAARRPNRASIASYLGWAKHCNAKNLLKKLQNDCNQNLWPVGDQIKKPDG